MKKILCTFALLFSMQTFAEDLQWSDLEIGQNYVLTTDLSFDNGMSLEAGRKMTLIDMIPGFGMPYLFLEFYERNCDYADKTADHGELVLKDSYGRKYVTYISIRANCHVGMFVHGSKLYDVGIFQ